MAVLRCIALALGMGDFLRAQREIAARDIFVATSVGGYLVVAGASLVLAGVIIAYVFLRLI